MNMSKINFYVNGKSIEANVLPEISLADFLHEKLGLTGTKVSCGIGVCKACTVAVTAPGEKELERVQACMMPIAAFQEYRIVTIDGVATENTLTPQQLIVLKKFSFQCGYCAPGFLMGITHMIDRLKRNPINKSDLYSFVEENMGDHICRCSGYNKYYEAIYEILLKSDFVSTN